MNDSAIRLIGEVLLFWGMGVVDVLLLLVWRWGWGRYDLYFLAVLVCVVRWMRGGGVDVCWRGLLISVRDNSRVVGWLRPCHPVFGGLRLWFGGRSLRREKDSRIGAAAAHVPDPYHEFHFRGPGGVFLVARGVTSGVLVGDVVHLLLIAAVSTGVWLRSSRPRAAGLWSIFGFPLRLNLALVELFGFGVFFK
jgi:hypothetical protein